MSGRPDEIEHATYHRPATVADALSLLAGDPRGRAWAGGTDLRLEVERGQRWFARCVDLSDLDELRGISSADDCVRVGALVTLDELARHDGDEPALRLIGDVARVMCTVQTRTLATVGGNLCTASPAADLAPALMALDARVEARSLRGARTIAIEDLFTGPKRTVLADDELLVAAHVEPHRDAGAGFARIARTTVDIALSHAAACVKVDGNGVIHHARVALCSVAPTPVRARAVERLLVGLSGDDEAALEHAARATVNGIAPIDDVRAGARYRREVSCVLVRRAVAAALGAVDRVEAWA